MASNTLTATAYDATFGAVTVTRRTDRAFTHAVIRVSDDGAVTGSFHMTAAAAERAAGKWSPGITRYVVPVDAPADAAPAAPLIVKISADTVDITDMMRREFNRGLMVAWINADLSSRADCDIRRSVVLYDADQMFVMALGSAVTPEIFRERAGMVADSMARIGVRFWSVGIA